MLRTFVALDLPNALREELGTVLDQCRRIAPSGVNWIAPHNMHLTLLFAGDTPQHQIKHLCEDILQISTQLPAFEIQILGAELFPAKAPRLLWLKLQCSNPDIYGLPKLFAKAFTDKDIQPDMKPLKLHVSLGRLKQNLRPHQEAELMRISLSAQKQLWDTLTYYSSTLLPGGPVYKPLCTCSLGN